MIELQGYHDFAVNDRNQGAQYVRDTLLTNLEEMSVDLPDGPGKKTTRTFTLKELGISYPAMVDDSRRPKVIQVPNPNYDPAAEAPDNGTGSGFGGGLEFPGENPYGSRGGRGGSGGGTTPTNPVVDANPQFIDVERFYFVVQFAWKETTVSDRIEAQDRQRQQQQGAATSDSVAAGG